MTMFFSEDAFPKLMERRKHTHAFPLLFPTLLPPSWQQTPRECTSSWTITSFHKLKRKKECSCQVFGRLTAARISVSISGIAYQVNLPVKQLLQIFVKPCLPYIFQPSLISSTLLIYFLGLFFFFNQTFTGSPAIQQSQHLAFLHLSLAHLQEKILWKNRVWVMLFIMIYIFLYFALIFIISALFTTMTIV